MTDIKNTMPKESKEKWIAALRSGQYKQTTGSLCRLNGYCCLGVMEHCLTNSVEIDMMVMGMTMPYPSINWLDSQNIQFMFGDMKTTAPTFIINDEWYSAIYLNDNLKYNFNQIADLIEEQVEGV